MLSYASRSSVHCAPLLRCKCIDTWPFSSVPVSLFPSPLCTGITGQTEALHCYCASTQSALTMRTTPTTLTQNWHGLIFQRYTARDTIGRMRRRKNCNQANWVWEGNEKWKWIVVERGKKIKSTPLRITVTYAVIIMTFLVRLIHWVNSCIVPVLHSIISNNHSKLSVIVWETLWAMATWSFINTFFFVSLHFSTLGQHASWRRKGYKKRLHQHHWQRRRRRQWMHDYECTMSLGTISGAYTVKDQLVSWEDIARDVPHRVTRNR